MSVRRASHAGSWYTDNGSALAAQLQRWLQQAETGSKDTRPEGRVLGVISPHAGYSYSGETAGYAFSQIKASTTRRVFVLGPSHHVYLTTCATSQAKTLETPVGNLNVDQEIVDQLQGTGRFDKMPLGVDEDEHSIEMQLPYVAQVMKGQDFSVVPVMVGSLTEKAEQEYGRIFAPYLRDPANVFVISSDFCHWGKRFRYTYVPEGAPTIFQGIEQLDREAMDIIEHQDAPGFATYLRRCKNTICGRHPIGVFLNALANLDGDKKVKFLKYAQSSPSKTMSDSSVSYAAAVAVITGGEA